MRKITYKKAAAVAMAAALSAALLVGCGSTAASTDSAAASTVADESTAEDAEKTADEGDADEVAAKNCADLIDAIYVQERSADTDAQCEAAKAAWDALTDTQKELVEGENADPDYFGRDTGDAGKDDPRNADDIGKNELLVVSFGTSFNGSRAADIKGIEDALQAAYPDWSVRRAFTAQIIINHVQARDGEKIDNMDQALDRAVANGVKNLVVQPTHLMHGAEYDEMCEAVEQYRDKFDSVAIAEPLLGEVGEDATVINADKEAVAAAITAEAARRGVAVVRCKGKSRRVLIPTRLQKKLLRYMKQHRIAFGPVFVTRSGAPLDRSNIWREMKALCRAAGVSDKKVFPHNFRHLFARTFYRLNKDLAKLADLLGHSSINTTRIYIRTTSAEHRRCLERMRLVL